MFSYSQVVEKLSQLGSRPAVRAQPGSLLQEAPSKIEKLFTLLGNPQHQFQAVHVAGTNGKGTTVSKIAESLRHDNKRVGVYTSPHIATFEERIVINNTMISEEEVVHYFQRIFDLKDRCGVDISYFETITLAAFLYFAEKKCDICVIETGLGGRYDATNCIDPLVSVITSISLDHTHLLGNTIEEITFEKAGIIKKNRPCVIGPCVPYHLVSPYATKLHSPLIQVTGTFSNFEEENRKIAEAVLNLLSIPKEAMEKGLTACPPCRFERIGERAILDVAHNPDAIDRLLKRFEESFPDTLLITIYGASSDKDFRSCIRKLHEKSKEMIFVEAPIQRAAKKEELVAYARSINPKSLFYDLSLEDAVAYGLKEAKRQKGMLVICGTFYIMAKMRTFLGSHS